MTFRDLMNMNREYRDMLDEPVPNVIAGLFERLNYESHRERIFNDGVVLEEPDLLGDLLEDLEHSSGHYDDYNLIPSRSKSHRCTDLLVTICNKDSKFEEYLGRSLDHAGVHCSNCKQVYFITSTWNSRIFSKYKGYIRVLERKGIAFRFLYFGTKGQALLPEISQFGY